MKRAVAAALMGVVLALTPTPAIAASDPLPVVKIATFGDSTSLSGKWQTELCRLMAQDAGRTCEITNPSATGQPCSYWIPRITNIIATTHPDLIILACGKNDVPVFNAESLGNTYRLLIETAHMYGVKVAPVLIPYADPLLWGMGQLAGENAVNNVIFTQTRWYVPPRTQPYAWLTDLIDWQFVPVGARYTQPDGLHPTAVGERYYGRLAYDRIAPAMGWPASSEPPLCDATGHYLGYQRPAAPACPEPA